MGIFGGNPLDQPTIQHTLKQQLNGEKWDAELKLCCFRVQNWCGLQDEARSKFSHATSKHSHWIEGEG